MVPIYVSVGSTTKNLILSMEILKMQQITKTFWTHVECQAGWMHIVMIKVVMVNKTLEVTKLVVNQTLVLTLI
jgi:hypothetical protein